MLESELESSIRSTIVLLDVDLPILTGEEWQLVKELGRILRPFERTTRVVSGELYMSASIIIVLTNGLLNFCEKLLKNIELLDLSKTIVKKLHDSLQERNNNIGYTNTLALCVFLDPHFKMYPFKNADAAENSRKGIIASLSVIIAKEKPNPEPEKISQQHPPRLLRNWIYQFGLLLIVWLVANKKDIKRIFKGTYGIPKIYGRRHIGKTTGSHGMVAAKLI
ncbi:unnamed protein product [Psylliodes chrysocephalus]|uniref:Uncharacterized protein n=1 Tax=Psylliodes chrysocephalus TaxID=3402493 RepID=A0A9P0GAZ4_9CUCU|nr:unnamed protein product [Psylliodes chrysocephala]